MRLSLCEVCARTRGGASEFGTEVSRLLEQSSTSDAVRYARIHTLIVGVSGGELPCTHGHGHENARQANCH